MHSAFEEKEYKKKFDVQIGFSDHETGIIGSLTAANIGAVIIERHITLDKKMKGPDQEVSIDFFDLKILVEGIRKIELSLGSIKKVHDKEKEIRKWAFRSVVAIKNIPKGVKITDDMVWTKRPGTGIPPKDINKVIGRRSNIHINKNTLLSWDQLI
mgnify:CR=1 FL=1